MRRKFRKKKAEIGTQEKNKHSDKNDSFRIHKYMLRYFAFC